MRVWWRLVKSVVNRCMSQLNVIQGMGEGEMPYEQLMQVQIPEYEKDKKADEFTAEFGKYIQLNTEKEKKDLDDVMELCSEYLVIDPLTIYNTSKHAETSWRAHLKKCGGCKNCARGKRRDADKYKRAVYNKLVERGDSEIVKWVDGQCDKKRGEILAYERGQMERLKLKPHQITSLYYLMKWEKEGGRETEKYKLILNFLIHGDPPGYGKTRVLCALVLCARHELESRYISLGGYTTTLVCNLFQKSSDWFCRKTKIIVPSKVIDQWKREFRLCGYSMWDGIGIQSEYTYGVNVSDYHAIKCGHGVLLYSKGQYKKVFGSHLKPTPELHNVLFMRCIIDEADTIDIPACPDIRAAHNVFVTATADCGGIKRVRNKGFLRQNFAGMNGIAYCLSIVANTEEFCKSSFKMIEPVHRVIRCMTPKVIEIVKDSISPEQLQMLNAGNISGLIEDLGGVVDSDRNIITLVTRKMETDIQDLEAKLEYIRNKSFKDESKREEQISECEAKIKSWETRIQAINERVKQLAKDECAICLCKIENPAMMPCCNHITCGGCIIASLNSKAMCPFCREDLAIKQLLILDNKRGGKGKARPAKKGKLPSKMEALRDTLARLLKNPKRRILVFSFHDKIGEHLGTFCDREGFPYEVMQGQTQALKERFASGETPLLLMHGKSSAAGIDLPWTTDIVFFHELEELYERQAIGRALRMSRKPGLSLTVHHLLYENEGNRK